MFESTASALFALSASSLLGVFTTALLGVFGILAVVLGFLTWRQNELRKQAEREMEKISNIAKEMGGLYRSYLGIMNESTAFLKGAQKILLDTKKKIIEIDKLASELKVKGEVVSTIAEKIQQARRTLDYNYKSLSTISSMSPTLPVTGSSILDDYSGSTLKRDYSREEIEAAREIIRKK